MTKRLQSHHAIITGANGGIGSAVLATFLNHGAQCTAVDLAPQPGAELKALLGQHPGAVRYVGADVTNTSEITRFVQEARESFGPITTLFNNAAIFDMALFLDSDEAMYDRIFDVNVRGMFFTMQTVLRQMVDDLSDIGRRGAIINMSSQAGRRGEGRVAHYCASKAAVISYTQSAAIAMAPHHIRVNAIAPGVIDTPMWDTVDSLFAKIENLPIGQKKTEVGKAVPLGRMGDPEDIVGAALFLASDESRYITAQTLNVDGGNVMS